MKRQWVVAFDTDVWGGKPLYGWRFLAGVGAWDDDPMAAHVFDSEEDAKVAWRMSEVRRRVESQAAFGGWVTPEARIVTPEEAEQLAVESRLKE